MGKRLLMVLLLVMGLALILPSLAWADEAESVDVAATIDAEIDLLELPAEAKEALSTQAGSAIEELLGLGYAQEDVWYLMLATLGAGGAEDISSTMDYALAEGRTAAEAIAADESLAEDQKAEALAGAVQSLRVSIEEANNGETGDEEYVEDSGEEVEEFLTDDADAEWEENFTEDEGEDLAGDDSGGESAYANAEEYGGYEGPEDGSGE